MMEHQQEETTPLQSVKKCCRRLRQEWEDMMQNADVISSEVLSSLKAQEAALMVEQKQIQSLKLETHCIRKSFFQTTQEQEKKASAERKLADEIKVNIESQLGEVKQLQRHLEIQLATMRDSMEKIKSSKQRKSADSLLLGLVTSELCKSIPHEPLEQSDLKIVFPLKDKDAGLPRLCPGSPSHTAHPDRFLWDAENKSFYLKDMKGNAMTSWQVLEQNHSKSKSEASRGDQYTQVLRGDEYTHLNEHSQSGSVALTCRNKPDRYQVDHVCVKPEYDEEAGGSAKDVSVKKFLYDAACIASPLEGDTDELDNVLLSERLEMLQKIHEGQRTKMDDGGILGKNPLAKKKSLGADRYVTGKRKWEVPIEIALQEDAPGLLEKLQERGVLEDITIYGGFCEEDWGNGNEHFKDLECIVKKIWGAPTGLIKLQPVIRQHASGLGKGPMYCLSCLISLIEQAKSLRQRNWPVEWGWCRELQAFIFVFDKHNRIVLERPEYGNATYFFELVQFLPVEWQVLRLIHVLSVTALGKTALLENRPLEVGYELTADESKILEGFGWAPGTGLGSFLNFCDRVIHDVKEDDNMEWRQKIGKCLMEGHDRGRIMTPALPPKFLKSSSNVNVEVDIKPNAVLTT